MKELDETTLRLVRYLNKQQQALAAQYRNLEFVVVWVDGDMAELVSWARQNDVNHVPICIACSNDESVAKWRLNPMAMSTIVFMERVKPVSKRVDLRPGDFSQIDHQIAEHFRRYRR